MKKDLEIVPGKVIVYAGQGPCTIEEIRMENIGGSPVEMARLRVHATNNRLGIPTANKKPLRLLADEETIVQVTNLLMTPRDTNARRKPPREAETWRKKKLQSGKLLDAAEVLYDIGKVPRSNEFFHNNVAWYHCAMNLVALEIAAVGSKPPADVRAEIEKLLAAT